MPVIELEAAPSSALVQVRHIVRGRTIEGADCEYRSRDLDAAFFTPKLELDELVWPRGEAGPAFECPLGEVIDFMLETGRRLDFDSNPFVREASSLAGRVNVLGAGALEEQYRSLGRFFTRDGMEEEVQNALGSLEDGWRPVKRRDGSTMYVRPYPSRMLHVMAGNAPGLAASSILRAALSRGVHLLKAPSNDLFTAQAVLQTMAGIDPGHPLVKSFSAAYWRGGDTQVESALYRPQFFDKIMAWGGGDSIAHVQKYLSPGLELVAMDPKTSISILGRECFQSAETIRAAATAAAADVGGQEGCANSRVHFVEASVEQADLYCAALLVQLNAEADRARGGRVTPPDVRQEVEMLRLLEPVYRVWGDYSGRGLVVRSEEPVDFDPIARTVNVVLVKRMTDAARYVNVATQTVGVAPSERRAEVRDAVCASGAQRTVTLGRVAASPSWGRPHDGFYPLWRMVRWVVDQA